MVDLNFTNMDPFFGRIHDSEWNACIGQQGQEQNYIDGYIQAAIELSNLIIEKKMYNKRDTLILPILYNARHSLELCLKFSTNTLSSHKLINHDKKLNHDIEYYWKILSTQIDFDFCLLDTIKNLEPFIHSLSRIDNDGQELRYHKNKNDEISLSDYSVANLDFIRTNLKQLESYIFILQNRSLEYISEYKIGTFTNRCSRKDLLKIAQLLPKMAKWETQEFQDEKKRICTRYNLSNRQFSSALTKIKNNREMCAILEQETPLLHITDDEVEWLITQWQHYHSAKPIFFARKNGTSDTSAASDIENHQFPIGEITERIFNQLTDEKIADAMTVYFLGRDKEWCEHYEDIFLERLNKLKLNENKTGEMIYYMNKTNLLQSTIQGLNQLGRLRLSRALRGMLADETT